MPIVFTRRHELLAYIKEQKEKNRSIGFVPTMGALHVGHAQLITQACSENACTVVSIFVNPKQFGPNEDFTNYPRTFQNDLNLIQELGAQAVFAPTVEEMYPSPFATQVTVAGVTEVLCGAFRPAHFTGVATVVLLLMNLVAANKMYLGQKDFQQVQVIKKMVKDLGHPTTIVMVPTVREPDGLALSSRNRYLNATARTLATTIPRALGTVASAYLKGEKSVAKLTHLCLLELKKSNLEPQYLEFRKVSDITQLCQTVVEDETVLAIAQFIESDGVKVRLIDNIILDSQSTNKLCLEELVSKALS